MKNWKSLSEFDDVDIFRPLIKGIKDENQQQQLTKLFQKACQEYSDLFTDDFWFQNYYNESPIEYILPTIRRVYASFFIQTPTLFKAGDKRLELFQLQFNLEEFLKEISAKLEKNIKNLEDFNHLDLASTVLQLIVDNYVAEKVQLSLVYNPTSEIRDIKLQGQLKI